MSCILRSSKFARYVAGFARHVVINTPREFDGNILGSNHCVCQSLPRSLATQATVQHDSNLEYGLRKIDQGVRRTGRISRQDIEDILEELRNSRTATSSQSLLVIRCCGNLVPEELPETRTKLVQEIWQTLIKLNIPIDVSHYNALLRVYLENEYSFSPTEFLSDMESKGIEPNRVTYQRLIARYCQLGDIEGATRILEFMREKQLPVNENVFNALIMGHAQAGDMESAHGILSVMAQAGLEPTEDTYTTLLCGYAKTGDIEAIKKILDECASKELYLLDKDFLEIVYSLAVNGHDEHVPFILQNIRKSVGYNQDAINTILKLINKNKDDVALAVLKTMPRSVKQDGSSQPAGNFLIKQMVKIGRPPEKIIEVCNWLKNEELNDRGLLLAAETALQLANEKIAYPILKEMKDNGIEIRPHYFWPLLAAKASDPSGDGIIEVLCQMNNFNASANFETIKDYVIPNLKGRSSDIIAKLRQANISVGSSASNLVYSLLSRNDIEEAAIIASRVDAFYHPRLIRRPLTNALYNTKDVKSYVTLLRHVFENLDRRDNVIDEDENKASLDKNEIIASFILDLSINGNKFPELVEQVLAGLVEQGLSLSNITAEKIQEKLGEKMTDNISKLLDRLTSGELVPVPITRKPPSYVPSHKMNIAQLERLVQNLKAKHENCIPQRRQLLTLYCRAKELEKAENLLRELEQDGFEYTSGVHAHLIDLYCYHDNFEKALEQFEKFKQLSDEPLDNTKTLRLANVYLKNDRFNDAIELLNNSRKQQAAEESYGYTSLCWRTLNNLAEQGKTQELQTLFDTLFKNRFLAINNMVLGPLIKVHLVNNDIQAALDKFEECCNKFKATPWKNELTCRLIQAEDAERLQKLTDLSTSVHGEINSLYDLVFSFVECGRIRQARKILETPGLQSRTQKISHACQRYREEGLIKPLEGLKDATKDLNHIDRSDIYYQLLLSYIKQDDVEKAQGLWMQMQEEDIAPSEQFLYKLGTFLKDNNVHVPFVIPTNEVHLEANNEIVPGNVKILKRVQPQKAEPSNYWTAIKNGELDKALEILQQKPQNISNSDVSMLIEALVQKDRLDDASNLCLSLLQNNGKPVFRVFRFLLNKLSHKGDVNTLKIIGEKLNSDLKKVLSFDNRLCHAFLVAGQAEEYLDSLEKELDQASDADLNTIAEKFPRGGAIGILEKRPELVDKFEKLANKYAVRGVVAPMNVLWSYYFVQQEDDKAEEIWDKYLQNSPRIMFQRVVQHARDSKDENITEKLIAHLKKAQVTNGALGNAYSCYLDILVNKGKNDELISTFESCLKDVKIENLNRTAVLRVKDIYAQLNKPFNHVIPTKNVKGAISSSSSSDSTSEEVEAKAKLG